MPTGILSIRRSRDIERYLSTVLNQPTNQPTKWSSKLTPKTIFSKWSQKWSSWNLAKKELVLDWILLMVFFSRDYSAHSTNIKTRSKCLHQKATQLFSKWIEPAKRRWVNFFRSVEKVNSEKRIEQNVFKVMDLEKWCQFFSFEVSTCSDL